MKFGKEFASQMVPEWQAAYMNYNHLKILIKEILIFRRLQQNESTTSYEANQPLPSKASSLKRKVSLNRLSKRHSVNKDEEDEVILVGGMQLSSSEDYRTVFLRSSEDAGESEFAFFKRLDDEFNKVIGFYKSKVGEMVNEAEELSKQMNTLIALRIKVEDPDYCGSSRIFSSRFTDVIQETKMRGEQEMVSLDTLNHVKINVMHETPMTSLKTAFTRSKLGLPFSEMEIRDAEWKLKQAFIEFHLKLRQLKSYAYVAKLVESVEAVFIEHFCNGNRGLGMKTLRQKAKTDRHRVTFFTVLTLAAILSNLEMDIDEHVKRSRTLTELLPLGLVVLLIVFCPFDIIYRANRFFLITCIWHCVCVPLYKVTLPDFFMADQLTSQVQLFRNLEFYICYYGWGNYKKRDSIECRGSSVYDSISLAIAIIPYYIRCLQCLRRLFDGEDSSQAVNGLNYLSTIAAVIARTFYVQKKGLTLKLVAASASVVATVYNTYWDLVCDWGLLRRNSENPWLRDKLLLPHRSIYFLAMVFSIRDINLFATEKY
ncbi:hypothetical protein L1987_24616 [Smallanthus sonchifolius]|uniref:Uncharacterized protein n=1 Tax=Smallanthus sonchifolius TaxID=185202 RepID=A0ACB9IK84_9ASTR|nr:hypothetical protein L1987_24616 [Smallanthus sonchifolius]